MQSNANLEQQVQLTTTTKVSYAEYVSPCLHRSEQSECAAHEDCIYREVDPL